MARLPSGCPSLWEFSNPGTIWLSLVILKAGRYMKQVFMMAILKKLARWQRCALPRVLNEARVLCKCSFSFPWHHSTNSDSTARACLMLWKDFVWPKCSEFGWWCMIVLGGMDTACVLLVGGAWLVDKEMNTVSGGAWQIFWWCMIGWWGLLTGWFVLSARQVTRNEALHKITQSCMAVFGWLNSLNCFTEYNMSLQTFANLRNFLSVI